MISGEKILVTGVTGGVAGPLARFLATDNEVWGLARFDDEADKRRAEMLGVPAPEQTARERIAADGITPVAADLGAGEFDDLPEDFTYVLHLAWMRADFAHLEEAMRTNVEGSGLLLHHCRKAKAALVMSSTAVYSADEDPWHAYLETDPLGQGATGQTAVTSPTTKLGLESVARYCSRAYDLPIVITRLSTFMGTPMSFPAIHIRAVLAGQPMVAPHDPSPHSPIHIDDMTWQLEALLDAASTPANITNWCGDEVTTAQDWVRDASAWSGKEGQLIVRSVPGSPPGAVSDPTKRRSITGPCTTPFDASFRALYDMIAGG